MTAAVPDPASRTLRPPRARRRWLPVALAGVISVALHGAVAAALMIGGTPPAPAPVVTIEVAVIAEGPRGHAQPRPTARPGLAAPKASARGATSASKSRARPAPKPKPPPKSQIAKLDKIAPAAPPPTPPEPAARTRSRELARFRTDAPAPEAKPELKAKSRAKSRPRPKAKPKAPRKPRRPVRQRPVRRQVARRPASARQPGHTRSRRPARSAAAAAGPAGVLVPPRPAGGAGGNPVPVYPAEARENGWEGRVILHVQVGADGRAAAVRIARSSGFGSLDRAALSAVRRWRFRPATRSGVAVAAAVLVPIRFRLRQ